MSIKLFFIKALSISTGLLLLINLCSYFAEYHFVFELLTHFRVQYLVLFLLSSILFIVFFNKKWLLLSLIGLSINATPVLSIYLPASVDASEKNHQVSLLLSNVLSSNQSYSALLHKIQQKQPDIIVVLELNHHWAKALKVIDQQYPYQKTLPQKGNFGIGLYSKYPCESVKVVDFANNGVPSITASVRFGEDYLNLIATHPIPPMNEKSAEQQIRHLENLAQFAQSNRDLTLSIDKVPVLVAGDLNSTLWSPRYRNLTGLASLTNTRQGKGIYPSWSAGGILGYLMQIPLDHVLVTDSIYTKKFEKLDSIDSDHYPIYVELQF